MSSSSESHGTHDLNAPVISAGDLVECHQFMIRVDGGEAQEFSASTGVYVVAVMEAFGKLGMPYPCDVEIWSPDLLPDYGPYFYRIADFVDNRGNVYGCPAVMHSRRSSLNQDGGKP